MTALSGHEPQIKISIPAAASRLLGALRRAGFEAYVVGGCVRDSLLGRTPGDWDICTSARPEQVRTVFSAYSQILTGEKHGTDAVIVGGTPYEITTYRVDGQYHDSRHPDAVQFVPQVQPDLARRDFTINAMAYNEKEGLIDPNTLIIDAKSGTSGAWRGAKLPNLFCEVNENMKAYGVTNHRHTPEIEEQLGYAAGKEIVVNFTPHLVPMNRGILATEYATLVKKADGSLPSYEEVKAVYDKYYGKEKFVRVLEKDVCPETKWVEGSNYVDVNFKIDERTGRIVMMGALDNLVKGAAGQAVQNMNLLFGFDETEGLNMVPMFP